MSRRVSILILALTAGHASAQEPGVLERRRRALDVDPAALLDRDLPTLRSLPSEALRDDFLRQVSLRSAPPGSLLIRYRGLAAYVIRRIHGRLRGLWRDELEDAWEAQVLDDDAYRARLTRLYDAFEDQRAGGRWWERRWWESLPPGRGGAPARPEIHFVGDAIRLALGPVAVTSELRVYLEGALTLGAEAPFQRRDEGDDEARRSAWLERDERDPDDPPLQAQPPAAAPLPDAPPRAAPLLWPGPTPPRLRWRLALRPSLDLRTSGSLAEALRDVRLRGRIELSTSDSRLLDIELGVRYRPESDERTLTIQAVLPSCAMSESGGACRRSSRMRGRRRSASRSTSARPRRWRRWAGSPAESRTTSTTS